MTVYLQLFFVFAKIGLFGFGGGMAMLPIIYQGAKEFGLMSADEFSNLVAISQVTPGPIFITATFIGYLVAGFWGATVATVAMFTPPAVLTVLLSRFVDMIRDSQVVKAVLQGVRSAVIGMIFSSAVTIGQTMALDIRTILLFIVVFFISYKYNLSPIFLILGSGLVGLILFML